MPDAAQSQALREYRTSFPYSVREIETIELRQRSRAIGDKLDLVFCISLSSDMSTILTAIRAALAGIVTNTLGNYTAVRFAVVSFSDEASVAFAQSGFQNQATTQATLNALTLDETVTGGAGGYSAVNLALEELAWDDDAARIIVVLTKTASTEVGNTLTKTKIALRENSTYLFYGNTLTDAGYDDLVRATLGYKLTGDLQTTIVNSLNTLAQPSGVPVYLVNDNEELTATLETGRTVTFVRRSFAINPFTSGEDGALDVTLALDNTDFEASKFLAKAKKSNIPVEVTLRVFLSNDLSQPQNNPPLTLYAVDFQTKGSTVSCKLRWLDLHNSVFPNSFYTPERCPSLQ